MNLILQHLFDHLLNQSNPFFHEFVVKQLQNIRKQDQHQHDHEFLQQSNSLFLSIGICLFFK